MSERHLFGCLKWDRLRSYSQPILTSRDDQKTGPFAVVYEISELLVLGLGI